MPQKEMPWTTAMREHLEASEGKWLDKDEVLAIGAALVPEDVALHEMRSRSGNLSEARVLAAGRKSKALQGLSGLNRFGKVKHSPNKKMVMYLGDDSYSLGDLGRRVELLEELVGNLVDLVDSQQKQLDRLDVDEEVDDGSGPDSTLDEDFMAQLDLHAKG